MKYIITEDQNIRIKTLRVLSSVDEFVEIRLKRPFTFDICLYGNRELFLDHVISWVNEEMYYEYFKDIDDDTKEWHKIWNIYSDYIKTIYSKKIFDLYDKRCGK